MPSKDSGWDKVKKKKKKMEMDARAIANTRPLTHFVFPVPRSEDVPSTSGSDPHGSSMVDDPMEVEQSDAPAPQTEQPVLDPDDRAATPAVEGVVHYPSDLGLWGPVDKATQHHWVAIGPECCRNWKKSYPETKKPHGKQNRALCPQIFEKELANGETVQRDHLMYSPSNHALYCFPCSLFGAHKHTNIFCTGSGTGYSDWRNTASCVASHENSTEHKEAVLCLYQRQISCGRVDKELAERLDKERSYWKQVLRRCISVISFLCERGLALRGSTETFGSATNGNYLGMLELLAQYEPFLAEHIRSRGDRGRGNVHYLSKTVADELIQHMSARDRIIKDVQLARYFTVSVDSTPDISHIDQLTVIIRYVCPHSNEPVERFLTFLPITSHKGEDMARALLEYLASIGIDFQNCRGQSYDNASNMSGCYTGMQKHLKDVNPLCEYCPCAAHSLNLVGEAAVKCCIDAITFFGTVNRMYTFFASSTHRWAVLKRHLGEKKVPKRPSDTRWSAHADATSALVEGYNEFQDVLQELAADMQQKSDARHEAATLSAAFDELEFAFMAGLWHDVLLRFNKCSKSLQSETIDFTTAVSLLESLSEFVNSTRERFEDFETRAKELSGMDNYKFQARRIRRRKRQPDDGIALDVTVEMSPSQRFKAETFLPIIDQLQVSLTHRISAYDVRQSRFAFVTNFDRMTPDQIIEATQVFAQTYPSDVSPDFPAEFNHFIIWFKRRDPNDQPSVSSKAQEILTLIKDGGIEATFPDTAVVLRMYLSLMITNCSGERSFSYLKHVKNEYRSTMSQSRLVALTVLTIERDLLRQISFDFLIDLFASPKGTKKGYCWN